MDTSCNVDFQALAFLFGVNIKTSIGYDIDKNLLYYIRFNVIMLIISAKLQIVIDRFYLLRRLYY